MAVLPGQVRTTSAGYAGTAHYCGAAYYYRPPRLLLRLLGMAMYVLPAAFTGASTDGGGSIGAWLRWVGNGAGLLAKSLSHVYADADTC